MWGHRNFSGVTFLIADHNLFHESSRVRCEIVTRCHIQAVAAASNKSRWAASPTKMNISFTNQKVWSERRRGLKAPDEAANTWIYFDNDSTFDIRRGRFDVLSLGRHPLAAGCCLIHDTVLQPSGYMCSACKLLESNLCGDRCLLSRACPYLSALGGLTSLCGICSCCLWEPKKEKKSLQTLNKRLRGGHRKINGRFIKLRFALKMNFHFFRVKKFKRVLPWICWSTESLLCIKRIKCIHLHWQLEIISIINQYLFF